jgi:hypothetical protein
VGFLQETTPYRVTREALDADSRRLDALNANKHRVYTDYLFTEETPDFRDKADEFIRKGCR